MDIISVLKNDHRTVEGIFAEIEEASSRAVKKKEKLFTQLRKELTVHAELEEEILYPRLKEIDDLRHHALEAYEEHRLAKQLLAECSSLEVGSEEWDAKVKVLKDMVEHHVDEEEKEILKSLRAELSKPELKEMGEAFLARKQERESSPVKGVVKKIADAVEQSTM